MMRLLRSIDIDHPINLYGRRSGPGFHVRLLENDNDCEEMVRRLPRDRHMHVYIEDKLFDHISESVEVNENANVGNDVNDANVG